VIAGHAPDRGWRMCACDRAIPAHADAAPDPAGGAGCGMTWRPHAADSSDSCTEIGTELEERHITEVRPGGHLRQDASAGPALPNHHMSSEEDPMVGPTSAGGGGHP
jgi:hypothetical protein